MTFVISGPVLIGGGVMTIVFSVEVFSHFFLTLLLIWSDNQTRSKLYSCENVLNLVNETKTCVLWKDIWSILMAPCNQSFQVCVRLYKANFQVCVRLYKANQRVRDPELDNLLNIHEVWNILSRKCSWIFSCGFQVNIHEVCNILRKKIFLEIVFLWFSGQALDGPPDHPLWLGTI